MSYAGLSLYLEFPLIALCKFAGPLLLKLIANHSRFLILPDGRWPNVGSRVLSLTERRVAGDWQARFGHPLLLLETLVDPRRFHGNAFLRDQRS